MIARIVPATLPRKQLRRTHGRHAGAGRHLGFYSDGAKKYWIPACAGMMETRIDGDSTFLVTKRLDSFREA